MKVLSNYQFNKHLKHAYKGAQIISVSMVYNPLDNDIFTKTIKLSNDIIIKKTYFSNILKWVTINKLSADDLNSYAIYKDYIKKL